MEKTIFEQMDGIYEQQGGLSYPPALPYRQKNQ